MIRDPWQGPATLLSVNVAFNPDEQLSASLVTSPLLVVVLSYPQVELVNMVVFEGAVNVGTVLSVTVMV